MFRLDRKRAPEEPEKPMDGDMTAMVLTQPEGAKIIGEDEVRKAQDILRKYKSGKANLEARVVEDELWWELRHWEAIGRNKLKDNETQVTPTSAWLFNAILNKHADAMDN